MIEWHPSDSVALRDFLQTKAGEKLLQLLVRPESKADTIEQTALLARYADGVDSASKLINQLAYHTDVPTSLDPGYITWNKNNQ